MAYEHRQMFFNYRSVSYEDGVVLGDEADDIKQRFFWKSYRLDYLKKDDCFVTKTSTAPHLTVDFYAET
jgi:hypothetical protein